jgi:[ribosomal protein S18]-alanine N-acetyltransferase
MDSVPLTSHDFEIRESEPADFETLWRIDQECFPPGISYSRAELRVYMRRTGAFTLVAVSPPEAIASPPGDRRSSTPIRTEGTITGFTVAEAYRRMGHIITIEVMAAARGHGVGSVLLRRAEERLRSLDSEFIELETAVDNLAALRFYKKHGYSVVGTVPHYYSSGVDALELRKQLPIGAGDVPQK